MPNNKSYVKVSTPIRTIKSEIGQVKISLFNDQISFSFQPATQQKTEYGAIQYNGSPQVSANVRFSIGVASAIANLIRNQVIPASDANSAGHWDIFACKRNNYEAYIAFDVQNGTIRMTGTEMANGMKKQASYSFPVTIITDNQNKNTNIQGEAFALAELLSELGGSNEMPLHMRQYSQAVKENMPTGGFSSQQAPVSNNPSQPMNSWHPF